MPSLRDSMVAFGGNIQRLTPLAINCQGSAVLRPNENQNPPRPNHIFVLIAFNHQERFGDAAGVHGFEGGFPFV